MSICHIPSTDLVPIESIASGAYGEVWKGYWNGRGGRLLVAIKKIRTKHMKEDAVNELCNEVRVMVALNHESICRVYGQCRLTEEKEVWIVLEFVEGGNLYTLLHITTSPLPWSKRLNYAHYAAMAVNFLHSHPNPILHRDIKSMNFLVRGDKLLLTDFGLSKATCDLSDETNTTGTLRWAAPELFRNCKWTAKADIYSLGMVFYELASRELPWAGASVHSIVSNIMRRENWPEIPDDCPKEFAVIINQCWNQNPDLRPTAEQLIKLVLDALDAFQIKQTQPQATPNTQSPQLPQLPLPRLPQLPQLPQLLQLGPAPPTHTHTPTPSTQNGLILLVEDNVVNAKITSHVLRRHNFDVEVAGDGQIALETVKQNHANFHTILMDIHMPVMDGITCTCLVRQFERDNTLSRIPIIALTADATPTHRTACLEAGCDGFLPKPLNFINLINFLLKLNLRNS